MHVRSRTPAGRISARALRERDAESRARKATCMHVHGLLRMHSRAESWIHEGADGVNSLASHE
eukprot:617361-Pleurochrysis_carterae.AAC.1